MERENNKYTKMDERKMIMKKNNILRRKKTKGGREGRSEGNGNKQKQRQQK